ncbi:signal peptidase I [Candidatus Dojkabacteria bacterium]|uniref:Signal peptidase I n=1 Tax=Candidatus Dojkabacteria bacterium TaxID=2099670 RepID=A0A955RGY2_9BACT|nr:signal peptidase I [Candidatus Dojkabacteria bacterium]
MNEQEGQQLIRQVTTNQENIFVDILQSIAIAVVLSIFLYVFLVTPNEVDGPSMEPNYNDGDLLFTSKLHRWFNDTSIGDALGLNYQRGDVVVFQKPGLSDFVKRVIAVPGDTIRIEDGSYYVNDKKLEEYYDLYNDLRRDGSFLRDGDPPYQLGADEYFLSGDNRNVSHDSRALGAIKESWIKGKVIFRFWPLSEFGIAERGKSDLISQ